MAKYKSFFKAAAVTALLVVSSVGAGQSAGAAAAPAEVGATAASAGCGKTPTLGNGTHTISSNGKNRSFILKLPDNYNRNTPYRIVFGFHWRGGTATDVATGRTVNPQYWQYYGLLRLSNNSTIFVAPQGLGNGWGNAGGEDVTFVDNMLRRIEGDLCVETSRRFAVGFSWGGGMSFALACARPNVFRAVAVYAGGQISGCGGGTQPIAYLAMHGVNDGVLGISAGRALRDRFVRNNGCTPQNPREPVPQLRRERWPPHRGETRSSTPSSRCLAPTRRPRRTPVPRPARLRGGPGRVHRLA
ncbi:alpha/beta hydrolase family esterase [Lentzea kentuckyensis]|uniref:alpha/beta hydrolase family esterase n=1 Tax=Lentzea kentuckyensis TaxID=360086 RepID=UPI001B801CED